MPRIINFGGEHGNVSFPDDATDEQIASAYRTVTQPKPVQAASIGDYAGQAYGSLLRGAGNVLAGIPEGISVLRKAPAALLPESVSNIAENARPFFDPTYAIDKISESVGGPTVTRMFDLAGSGIRSLSEAATPEPVQSLQDSFLATKLPAGIGSAVAFMAGGVAGRVLKIPQWLTISSLGAASGGSEFYKDAKASGADDGTATIASLIGNVVGTSEAIPLAGMIGRLNRATGNTFGRALVDAGKETLEEAMQEAAQTVAQNFTAQQLYDKDRDLFKDLAESTAVGGSTGFLLSALTSALGAGRSRMRSRGATPPPLPRPDAEQSGEAPPPIPSPAKGVPAAQPGAPLNISQVVQDITSQWQNAPPIRIATSVDEIPKDIVDDDMIRQQMSEHPYGANGREEARGDIAIMLPADFDALKSRALGSTMGFLDVPTGAVWIMADRVKDSAQVKRIILHEVIGHTGVRAIIQDPASFQQFMSGVAERHADTDIGREVRSIYGNNAILVGEEIVAKLAENPQADPSLWNQITAAVRGWVRQVFNIEVSDNEIQVLLSKARKNVEGGPARAVPSGVGTEEGARFNAGPRDRIPIQIQSADGTIRDAEFTGYYDLTSAGKGYIASVGWTLPNGQVTHGMLRADEKIIGTVPTGEEWTARQGGGTRFAAEKMPQFFQTRQQVTEATSSPGLKPDQIQEAEELAKVQASMAPDSIVGWLMATAKDVIEEKAQRILAYIEDRRYLSPSSRPLSSFPEGTDEEKRLKELAGALVLGHYGVDRAVDRKIDSQIVVDQGLMDIAVKKIGKITSNQLKANFLTALFNNLTTDYRVYLAKLTAAAPASGNLQAQWRQRLTTAERRLNDHEQSPVAIQKALSAIAVSVPAQLLTSTATNQQVIDWVLLNGTLNGVVGQDVKNWLLSDDGTGQPALINYTRLISDLATLNDVLTKQQEVAKDIEAFQQWFKASGGKVSAKEYAEKYFKFRTGRDRALKIAAATEKEIGDLDTRIRANIMARDRLTSMMRSDEYVKTVREAAQQAHVVVRALHDFDDQRTGLIDRDKAVGLHRLKGPTTNAEYVVDLYPTSSQETQNKSNLSAWMAEARQWAIDNAQSDPLLADEYNNLADYIERHLMHPALDPKSGFTRLPVVKIPGTNIRFNPDPFDFVTSVTSAIGYSFQTIRDVIDRIGGRTMRQAASDAAILDTVMRKVEAINSNPAYGFAAQTQADLKAIASHGWTPEQFAVWEEKVVEPVLAAGQNRLSPGYEVGDIVVGSGVALTPADVVALRLMKQWGDAIMSAAPNHVQDRLSDLGITRKAIGNGRYTGHRVAAVWTREFVKAWDQAATDADKLELLKGEEEFRQVIIGYMSEYNPEFSKMNPASSEKSPLFSIYRRLANTEKAGVQSFNNIDEVLDFVAAEMVKDGLATDHSDGLTKARETLLSEIKGFVKSFDSNVLGYVPTEVWGGVPSAVVAMASANNSFTTPRGRLLAPSTFYTYSVASEGRRLNHVGSLRSLLNLKLLQSGYEARAALETKKAEMEKRIANLMSAGATRRKARGTVFTETAAQRQLGEIRYDYREILIALRAIEQSFGNLERYEKSTADHYEHAGVAAWNNAFGTVKSSLLSSTQAVSTNFWSGSLLGPALIHWQTGQFLRAIKDVVPAPHMWKTVMARVSALVAGNPQMRALLNKHAPLWDSISKSIIEASADWARVQRIAESMGMVNPYNLRKVLANKAALKSSAGRLTTDDPHQIAEWVNTAFSAPGVSHATETLKATAPRIFDNWINYAMVTAFEQEVEFLKKMGWVAFKVREDAGTANNTDWQDLTNPDNVLKPGDLGLRSRKALDRYQQLFIPLGSLDVVLFDFYEKTKNMTPDQRESEPLLNNDDYGALALQYAATSNVSVETNRPYSMKGKGSDGVWRNIVGTFMGWSVNMMKQFSKALQTHSGDKNFEQVYGNMIGLATIIILLSAVGAWNWEFGDELTKKLYGQSSARIQPGNIKDVPTALTYFAQSLVNTVPIFGSTIGGFAGVAFTGRGTPFDMASLSPHIGFVADVYNTARRVIQTGDATLPLADFTKRWIPLSKIVVNRLPTQRGLMDQQNAIRAMNASAPPGTEIKWGQRGGGMVKYGPANDEIQKLIASAYEATAHGASQEVVRAALNEAVAAYARAGRSPEDAEKAVTTALAAKEPVRVLTGREMTPEEERRWVNRMTPEQKVDYEKAKAAWRLLGLATGKDFEMVSGSGGGGGGGGISGMPSAMPTSAMPSRMGISMPRMAAMGAIGGGGGSLRPLRISRPSSGRIRRPRTARLGRRTRSVLRSPRQRSPRITTQRRRLGTRRRTGYVRA